jgi:hypothetical protein
MSFAVIFADQVDFSQRDGAGHCYLRRHCGSVTGQECDAKGSKYVAE